MALAMLAARRPLLAAATTTRPVLLSGVVSASSRRTFSASAVTRQQEEKKYEWLVILPDRPGMLDLRMSVRPLKKRQGMLTAEERKHLKELKPAVDDGFWVMGGATLDAQPADSEQLKINGSIMLAVASSRDEVLQRLKQDVYSSAGVWDLERVEIRAFRSAIRKEL